MRSKDVSPKRGRRMSRESYTRKLSSRVRSIPPNLQIETDSTAFPIAMRKLDSQLDGDKLRNARAAPPLTFKGLAIWVKATREFDQDADRDIYFAETNSSFQTAKRDLVSERT